MRRRARRCISAPVGRKTSGFITSPARTPGASLVRAESGIETHQFDFVTFRVINVQRPPFNPVVVFEIGLALDSFVVENLSLPEELQQRFDERTGPGEPTVSDFSEERWRRKSTSMGRCPRNAVERSVSRRFHAGACIGFRFPGAGRSATKELAATGARSYTMRSCRTARMEIRSEPSRRETARGVTEAIERARTRKPAPFKPTLPMIVTIRLSTTDAAARAAQRPGVVRLDDHTIEGRVATQAEIMKWINGTGLDMLPA